MSQCGRFDVTIKGETGENPHVCVRLYTTVGGRGRRVWIILLKTPLSRLRFHVTNSFVSYFKTWLVVYLPYIFTLVNKFRIMHLCSTYFKEKLWNYNILYFYTKGKLSITYHHIYY